MNKHSWCYQRQQSSIKENTKKKYDDFLGVLTERGINFPVMSGTQLGIFEGKCLIHKKGHTKKFSNEEMAWNNCFLDLEMTGIS